MNRQTINDYYAQILPFYKMMADNKTVQEIDKKRKLSFFCTQWGDMFPETTHEGLLFVGRATNGWGNGIDPEQLPFNDPDQMKWVDDIWDEHNGANGERLWRGNSSAFWRVIRSVTERYHKSEWFRHVSWSNLYKCSFLDKGNPSALLRNTVIEQSVELLKVDVSMLSPKAVIMIAGKWEKEILARLFPDVEPSSFEHGGVIVNGTLYIATERPERRPEAPIVESICAAIDNCGKLS